MGSSRPVFLYGYAPIGLTGVRKGLRDGGMDDRVGHAIYPHQLDRVLGKRFTSVSQIARRSGITIEQGKAAAEYLLKVGMLQPWLAPKCSHCTYTWPAFLGEDDITETVMCPMCNEVLDTDDVNMFEVYEMIGSFPEEE